VTSGPHRVYSKSICLHFNSAGATITKTRSHTTKSNPYNSPTLTMPRRKAPAATFASIIDPNSDDDFAQTEISAMMPTPDSADDKRSAAAAGVKRRPATVAKATAARNTKPASKKSAAASTSGARKAASVVGGAAKKKRARPALKDLTNVTEEDIDEDDGAREREDEEDEEDEEEQPQRKRAKGVTSGVNGGASKRRQARPATTKTTTSVAATQSRNGRAGSAVPVVDDTQAEPSIEMPDEEMPANILPVQTISRPVSRSVSRQPELLLSRNRRAGSASSTDRGVNDPALRRRLGEMTNKYESLEIKYNNLKDIASAEAQTNFDKLKNATDLRTKSKIRSIHAETTRY
jgi:hypothetical protein